MIVRELEELQVWQIDKDERLIGLFIDAADSEHPLANLAARPLVLTSPINVSICELCGSPEFLIRDGVSGITETMCRVCINAVRRQSHHHGIYVSAICIECEICYDSVGLIHAANHRTMPFEDTVISSGEVTAGLNPLIEAGRVDLTDDILTIQAE